MASDGLEVQDKAKIKTEADVHPNHEDTPCWRASDVNEGHHLKMGKFLKQNIVSNVNIMSKMWAESGLWLTNIYCSVVDGRFSTYIVREFDKSSCVIFRQQSCFTNQLLSVFINITQGPCDQSKSSI